MVKIYYVRHGHAEHNKLFEELGVDAYNDPRVTDSTLTSIGLEQTRLLSKECSSISPITVIIVSPLSRCLETVEQIMTGLSYKPRAIALDEMIEWSATHTPNHRKDKSLLSNRFPSIDFNNIESIRNIPLSDSIQDLEQRINAFKLFVKNFDDNERILVVGHTSWLNQLLFSDVKIKDLHHARIYESANDNQFVVKD